MPSRLQRENYCPKVRASVRFGTSYLISPKASPIGRNIPSICCELSWSGTLPNIGFSALLQGRPSACPDTGREGRPPTQHLASQSLVGQGLAAPVLLRSAGVSPACRVPTHAVVVCALCSPGSYLCEATGGRTFRSNIVAGPHAGFSPRKICFHFSTAKFRLDIFPLIVLNRRCRS
jgi:hypothetical protein